MRVVSESPQISVIDPDTKSRDLLYAFLNDAGFSVRAYMDARQFLSDLIPKYGCLIANMQMPDMNGLQLQDEMVRRKMLLPVIFITDRADLKTAVKAIRAGAIDYLEKPFDGTAILASAEHALLVGQKSHRSLVDTELARAALKLLTPRERSVLDQLALGRSNKDVAHKLGISTRTVEFHRAHIMEKLDARNMADVLRVSLTAELASHGWASGKSAVNQSRDEFEAAELPLWTAPAKQARLF